MTIMVSAQNLIEIDAAGINICYGVGGCNISLSESDVLMTTPSDAANCDEFALTYTNNNNNGCVQILRASSDHSILSLASGTNINGSNYHPDCHRNHNKSVTMAEAEAEPEAEAEVEADNQVVAQEQYASRICNSINERLSSSSNKPGDREDQLQQHHHRHRHDQEEEEEEGSWLQLGIGGSHRHHDESTAEMASEPSATSSSTGLLRLELNLGGGGLPFGLQRGVISSMPAVGESSSLLFPSSSGQPAGRMMNMNMRQQQQGWGFIRSLHHHHHHQGLLAPGRSSSLLSTQGPSSSSASPGLLILSPPPPPFFLAPPTASDTFTVIDPPPRTPYSDIWFMLLASHPQTKQPFLPQVPKRFLRIKDGRMTVGLVMKYVANKLGLDSESEVEIRCRGQELEGKMRLLEVRDNIWSSARDAAVTLLRDSPASDHIMLLHYARR